MTAPLTISEGRIRAMTAALDELAQSEIRAVSVPFFSPDDIAALIRQCQKLPMRQAKPRVGAEGREVVQDFDICFPAPRDRALGQLADMLEDTVKQALERAQFAHLDEDFILNDLAVQHYPPKSKGIGVHME
ncbi:MAG: hypothetical protein VW554_03010, partial [Alphaproteobacteria bacterium]